MPVSVRYRQLCSLSCRPSGWRTSHSASFVCGVFHPSVIPFGGLILSHSRATCPRWDIEWSLDSASIVLSNISDSLCQCSLTCSLITHTYRYTDRLNKVLLPATFPHRTHDVSEVDTWCHTHTHIYIYVYIERERQHYVYYQKYVPNNWMDASIAIYRAGNLTMFSHKGGGVYDSAGCLCTAGWTGICRGLSKQMEFGKIEQGRQQ